jgi:hypothetical protein
LFVLFAAGGGVKGRGFRIVVLRVYEGDDKKLAERGSAIVATGYHSNAGLLILPEYRLAFDDENDENDE